eukprot:TRINITY_DN2495_c0_g1_i1.p1 TRINITY_DN2495_c0_g1~~TRINITY_DN2495_c0_g1_i1.p1  ORF type:complete len:433 (+),score=81.76 TRINITY_DN2495_c0_g1_i1:136-1434(+)
MRSRGSSSHKGDNYPTMFFIKQSTPQEEKIETENGETRMVNVVVKNSPFTFQIGLTDYVLQERIFNFNHITLQTSLIYDDDEGKEVDFVKTKPLECKSKASPSGEYAFLQLRIQVLSSHHEDTLFRVKVNAVDPISGKDFVPPIFAVSNPIKVVSKPEQQKQKRKLNGNLNELLLDAIKRLEQKQDEQQKKIGQLFDLLQKQQAQQQQQQQQINTLCSGPASLRQSCINLPLSPLPKETCEGKRPRSDPFESALMTLVQSYQELPQAERATKMRKIVNHLPTGIVEMFDTVAEVLGKQQTPATTNLPSCSDSVPSLPSSSACSPFIFKPPTASSCTSPATEPLKLNTSPALKSLNNSLEGGSSWSGRFSLSQNELQEFKYSYSGSLPAEDLSSPLSALKTENYFPSSFVRGGSVSNLNFSQPQFWVEDLLHI